MMGIVLPETCWACNKICNKYHLLHLVGILFPHIIFSVWLLVKLTLTDERTISPWPSGNRLLDSTLLHTRVEPPLFGSEQMLGRSPGLNNSNTLGQCVVCSLGSSEGVTCRWRTVFFRRSERWSDASECMCPYLRCVSGVPDSSPRSTCVLFGRCMLCGQSVHSCPELFLKVGCTAILDTWLCYTDWTTRIRFPVGTNFYFPSQTRSSKDVPVGIFTRL